MMVSENQITIVKENVGVEEDEHVRPLSYLLKCEENYQLFKELCDGIQNRDIQQTPWQHKYYNVQDLKGSSEHVDDVDKLISGDSVPTPSTSLEPIYTNDQDDRFLEPPLKRLKKESEVDISMNVSGCQVDVSFSQRSDPLTREDWEKVSELRSIWHGGGDVEKTTLPSQISLLCTVTPNQVKEICGELELESLTETGMLSVCDDLYETRDKLGYSNSLHLLSALILPKLEEASQTLPRFLINIVMRLSKQFPRQMIEGVIIPRLQYAYIASSETDIFCKMTRENFTESNTGYLLQKLLDVDTLTEGILCVLQVLVDLKISLQTADLVKLVPKLRAESISQADNLKFAKLLFALITKYGHQMDTSLIEQIQHIAVENKTFMKKAITSAVLKLERRR